LRHYGVRNVLTIDKCQGIDCDIVIISCAKQTPDSSAGSFLFKDLKRLNVALTRSRKMLVMLGSEEYLREISPLD
jgi:superfamily I DNA and/or RNA helicase